MAFGAVATGNINAHEAEIAAGIISISIGRPVLMAADASIGNTKVVVARLEFNSVKNVIEAHTNSTISNGDKPLMLIALF